MDLYLHERSYPNEVRKAKKNLVDTWHKEYDKLADKEWEEKDKFKGIHLKQRRKRYRIGVAFNRDFVNLARKYQKRWENILKEHDLPKSFLSNLKRFRKAVEGTLGESASAIESAVDTLLEGKVTPKQAAEHLLDEGVVLTTLAGVGLFGLGALIGHVFGKYKDKRSTKNLVALLEPVLPKIEDYVKQVADIAKSIIKNPEKSIEYAEDLEEIREAVVKDILSYNDWGKRAHALIGGFKGKAPNQAIANLYTTLQDRFKTETLPDVLEALKKIRRYIDKLLYQAEATIGSRGRQGLSVGS